MWASFEDADIPFESDKDRMRQRPFVVSLGIYPSLGGEKQPSSSQLLIRRRRQTIVELLNDLDRLL